MDRIDQFPALTLAGGNKIAAQVDYLACDRCGFRLMRVETTIIGEQQLVISRCPICERFKDDTIGQLGVSMHAKDRLMYFDTWLATHGLDRETLEYYYHLSVDHFFEDAR